MINRTLSAVGVEALTPTLFHPGLSTPPNFQGPTQYLLQHGYTQVTTYQPRVGSGRSNGSKVAGCSRSPCS